MIAAEVMVPCISSVAGCRPDWAAIAAMGGWVAAIVTFLAVILPMKRRKSEDRAAAKAAMVDFAEDLIALRDSMGIVGFLLNTVKPGGDANKSNALVRGLSRQVSVPTLTPTPETLSLVEALNRLRRAVIRWNETVATFDVSYDPELGGAFEDHLIEGLKRDHDRLMNEIRAVARMIRPMVQGLGQDLDLIITSGNGFLPIPHPPDEL